MILKRNQTPSQQNTEIEENFLNLIKGTYEIT